MLRLLTGVVLVVVAVTILTGVDVRAVEMFSNSESESWFSIEAVRFLFRGAINLNISFWFSASIFDRSDKISFLKDAFITFRSSGSVLEVLLQLATKFSARLFSAKEVSSSPDANSATAFFSGFSLSFSKGKKLLGFLRTVNLIEKDSRNSVVINFKTVQIIN